MDQESNKIEEQAVTASLTPVTKKNRNMKNFGIGFVTFLALVAVFFVGLGIYRVYAKVANDAFSLGIAKALRLPAAKVNGERILVTDYLADLKAITVMRSYDREHNGRGADLSDEQMSDQVLLRLASNIVVEQAAKQFGLKIEDSDLAALRDQVLKQFKTPAEVDAELMKRYGWNFSTYEQKVVRPFVLQNKLTEKIQSDQSAREAVRAKAQDVLEQIKKGADFAELAKKYGQDGTAPKGGDLGWFGKGEMVPQFEAAAFALKKGELSPALVETPYGYHIIRVEDKKSEKVKNEKGKMVAQEKVQASHILFLYPSLQTYLDQAFNRADTHLYLRVHNPFKKLAPSEKS